MGVATADRVLRQVADYSGRRPKKPIQCPAGKNVSGDCSCGLEGGPAITPETSPVAYYGYCTDRYTECPTWRAYKEAEWKSRKLAGLNM